MTRACRAQRGNTLFEVTAALAVLGLVLLGLFAAYRTSLMGWQVTQVLAAEQHGARVVLEWLSRRVRMIGAGYTDPINPPVVEAKTDELTFWVTDAECHRLYLSGGVVYDRIGTTCAGGTARPLTSSWDGRPLQITALNFRYFDASTDTPELLPPAGSDALAATDLPYIRRIEIRITATGRTIPFVVGTQVVIRNGR